ncbi:MAG: amidohydrolase family protein [Planctomycetes bacterium]|nr:amidohydrolase family protein [Planctomycetota bacterium]
MNPYALIADRVWDGVADTARVGQAVVVRDGRIEAVVPVEGVERGLARVELPGCTLLPGLIDAHVHYSASMGPGFLAAGVTTIRDVGNDLEWILRQRELHAGDPLMGPAILCCGHLHDGARRNWPRMGKANADEAALRESIKHHVSRGVDQIKLYAGLNLEMLTAGVDESHKRGKFVLAHLGATKAEEACRAGLDEIEHLDQCGVAWRAATAEEDDVLIDLMLEHKVVIDPTLVVWDRLGRILERSFHHDERRRWVHPCHLDIWNRYLTRFGAPGARLAYQAGMPHLKRFLLHVHARGVTVAVGTDTPFPHLVPGFSVHDELAMFVDAGIKAVDALRSATSINTVIIGAQDRAGRIAPGLSADLLAVRGDPLQNIADISNVAHVVRAGVAAKPDDLLRRVSDAASHGLDDPITNDLLDYIHNRR